MPRLRRRGTFRWWRQTLIEIAVLFTIVVTAEIVLGDGRIGSYRVHPHPYWLIVLPMAAARGLVAGLLTSAVATALYAIGAREALGEPPWLDLLEVDILLEPLLFHAVGFVVGEFRDVITDRYREQAARLADVQQRALRFRKQRDVLAEANRILESRLVDHSAQFGNLIVTATRIELGGRREVFEIALELVEEHCGAAASILVPVDGTVDFVTFRGWGRNEQAERLEDARNSAFVATAIETGVEVNGFAPGESAPPRGPLIVAPLLSEFGVIEALLCLDEIPASRLNPSTVRTFLAIAEWIGAAMARLGRERAAQAGQERVPSLHREPAWIGTPEDLGRRLRVEYERCTRYGVPLSFITIQFPDIIDGSFEIVQELDDHVRSRFAHGLRGSDSLYRFGFPGCYVVVLAGTPGENAEAPMQRLLRRIAPEDQDRYGRTVLATAAPDVDAPDPANLLQRLTDGFREDAQLLLAPESPVKLPEGAPAADLQECVHRVHAEVDLAMRWGHAVQVIDISGSDVSDGQPGLLALHVEHVCAGLLRGTDGVYCVGKSHVAIVLPHTEPDEAQLVAQRLSDALLARDPTAPFGEITLRVLSLGEEHPDASSLLYAVAELRDLEDVEVLRSEQ